ncbi:serine--tRNA ligase [bacterium]|nr:serine--tRNA ligase [bacterium]
MLDLKFIRENVDQVRANADARRIPIQLDQLLTLAQERLRLVADVQEIHRQQNEVARLTKQAKTDDERAPLITKGRELKAELEAKNSLASKVEADTVELQRHIPNLTHPDVPRGDENITLREVLPKPAFDFKPLDHVSLCERLGLADFEKAAKVTGSSFYYLKGDGVLLEQALINFAIRTLVAEGFTPVTTPDLARTSILEGTGYMPRGPETQIYTVANSDLCLIATAEITLAGMFADEIIEVDDLPIRLAGLSHCFRTEAGAAGRATKGLYRVHQFTKVEMFEFTTPEQSEATHQKLLAIEERIFQGLEIPYRVIDTCVSDLGGPAYRKYDLEAWMPGRGEAGEWGEVTSTSNCTDYQARRLNIRFKVPGQKGTQFVHMLNGTAVATARAIVALLENHQQADGSIRIPAVLIPYMGKDHIVGNK